jgi:PAS domain-containing protein
VESVLPTSIVQPTPADTTRLRRGVAARDRTRRELVRLRLGQVVEQAADGVLVLDTMNRVVLANPNMCAMPGNGHDKIVGLDILETCLPEERPKGAEHLGTLRSAAGRGASGGSCGARTGARSRSRCW